MSTLVGMQLSGRYRLDAQIGAGGMSTVYRAFDQTLERQVAIKLMHREIASDSDQLERFRREARAVAQLSHPHIVGVIDAGEDEGRPYIVFEYVEGETLKERIRRMGRLPVDEAIAYAIEIARALGCAHGRHIVHRDVKPQNVLIDGEGSAKVTDFGIARTLDQEGLTADGRVLGTTDYVSPEQALGHDVNGQSDIYALGVVLYEMLVGDVPFHGENQVSVAMKHVREDMPDLQSRRPEASATLASVLDRMTDKDLARRYPDVPSLVADLEEALAIEAARSGKSTGEATAVLRTLPASTRRRVPFRVRHPLPLLGVIGLLAVLVAIVALVLKEAGVEPQRGTGSGKIEAPAGEAVVSLARASASDYDPLGDDDEHHAEAARVVDRDFDTTWSTESYRDGLAGASKAGVGIYLDAKPGVDAVRMEIRTPEPGWKAEIYGAAGSHAPASIESGWTKIGGGTVRSDHQRFKLDTGGKRYRFYLLWITELPPDQPRVEVSELALFYSKR
jgi:eukaryotic-like serine/threonine-protein kinase